MAQSQSPIARKEAVDVTRPGVRLSRRAIIGFVVTTLATASLLVLLFFRLMQASSQTSSFSTPGNLAGQPAPDFTVQVWNGTPGQKIHLADLKGHPVLVNFYASWCYDCTQEEPFLQAAWQKYQGTGLRFIGIAYQDKQSDSIGFLQKYGVTYPSGQDLGGTASTDYAVTGVPETVLINSQGIIVQKYGGALDERTLNDALAKLVHQ